MKEDIKERKKAIVCIACNEDNYIEEWIDYHFSIGFDDAYVFMNNWRCSLDTSKYAQSGHLVMLIPYDGSTQQLNAYNAFISMYIRKYGWTAFIDVDEFIAITNSQTLDEILEEYSTDGIWQLGLNWRLFGSSGIDKYNGEKNVLRRFTHCDSTLNMHTKQIVDLSRCREDIKFVNPHFTNTNSYNQEKHIYGGPFNKANLECVHRLELYHYITKSREECRDRRSRVRADCACVRAEGWLKFFSDHDKNDVLNLNMVHWLDSHDIKNPLFSTHLEANPH